MTSVKDISRRNYLTAFGGIFASVGLGGTTAYSEYQKWKSTPYSEDMKIIGHRGANGLAPQNTRKGIQIAAEYNVDGVELDVQETSDGELVMFHDPVYDVASSGSGFVSEVPYDQAKDFTIEGEPLLTLDEAVAEVRKHDLELFLEVKSPNIIDKCLDVIERYSWKSETTFISLDSAYLVNAHDDIKTGLIQKTPHTNAIGSAEANGFDAVATHYVPVNQEEFITTANDEGLDSIIWSLVDTRTSVADSLKTDADILIANRPDIVDNIYSEFDVEH